MKEIKRKIESEFITCISFEVDSDFPDFLANYLLDWLNDYLLSGAVIKDDETLQFGFSLLRFCLRDKILSIEGPDYTSIPFTWTKNLSRSLLAFSEQKYTVESFELNPEYSKLQDTATVGVDFEKEPFMMRRYEPAKGTRDSGWFIGSSRDEIDNNDPKNLSAKSLYEVVLKQPKALPYLLFPQESIIVFEDGNINVMKDDDYLEPHKNSYVVKKNNTQ